MTANETLERINNLHSYYAEALTPDELATFDGMIREMAHLTRQDQLSTFAVVYLASGQYDAKVVSSAIGFTQKCIERGYHYRAGNAP